LVYEFIVFHSARFLTNVKCAPTGAIEGILK